MLAAAAAQGIDHARCRACTTASRPEQPAARKPPAQQCKCAADGAAPGDWFEHVPSRGGLGVFERTEAAPDPLRKLARVHDLVLHSRGDGDSARGARGSGAEPAQRSEAAGPPSDAALLANYLSMVDEYLGAAGRSGRGAAASAQADDRGQQQGAAPDAMDGDYVYDLYAAASDADDAAAAPGADAEWLEAHAAGAAPVVRILDDGTWLVVEAADEEGSDAGAASEDSNAEGFYAHDYPGAHCWQCWRCFLFAWCRAHCLCDAESAEGSSVVLTVRRCSCRRGVDRLGAQQRQRRV